jgi:DNA-directed RNA polymerase specialized sigma24 family protein
MKHSPSPEGAALSSERLATLARCLTDLSDREREVIGLRFVARLRNRDIGALVPPDVTITALHTHRLPES